MKRIIYLFLIAFITLSGSACSVITKPTPYGLQRGLVDGAPEGTPAFRYGWKDGCESGLAAYGTLLYKAAYSYKYDSASLQDNEYHNAWEMGFRHCRWYVNTWTS